MASAARLSPDDILNEALTQTLEKFAEKATQHPQEEFLLAPLNPVRVLVAFSGGRDSTALADLVARIFHDKRRHLIASVTVVHVHHGLSENADQWLEHARAMCAKWKLNLREERVFVNRYASVGLEAAAREARYRALFRVAREEHSDVILTAHHADDQLETFLIQWIRGAGPEGLSSMYGHRRLCMGDESAVVLRPWLEVPRATIDAYVRRHKLAYVEDESNTDTRFMRNLIRNSILPVLDEARPGWRAAAARSVGLVTEAAEVLSVVGAEDMQRCLAPESAKGITPLAISRLLLMPMARQALTLRQWLASNGVRSPSKVRLYEALRQVRETNSDNRLAIRFEGKELRRWGDNLVLRDVTGQRRQTSLDAPVAWNGEPEIGLPLWGGALRLKRCGPEEPGISAERLRKGALQVRSRKGGEKLKLHALRPSRNLKHLYQAAGIPEFERSGLPLVWLDGELVFAAGLGLDIRFADDPDLNPERYNFEFVPDKPLLSV